MEVGTDDIFVDDALITGGFRIATAGNDFAKRRITSNIGAAAMIFKAYNGAGGNLGIMKNNISY